MPMGLLSSSRRKQSRDLGDSAADDTHVVCFNGHGDSRRRKSQYPVLVRTRTLSTEENHWGSTNGIREMPVVLQNGVVSGERELKKLLADTQPVGRWQDRLKRLLGIYIMPHDAFKALAFLQENMDTAIIAVQDPTQSLGYPALCINIDHKPQIFDLQHWKGIMYALHFELTEPDGRHDIDLVEVKVTRQVTLGSLLGFKFLLHCLSNISWDMLRMLLSLSAGEALGLLAVMQNLHSRHHGHVDLSTLQDLYARYPHQMSELGFTVNRRASRKRKEVTWLPPQSSDSANNLEVALIGLFHNGSGLETYI
ncbi:uncharacterized protein LOC143295420 isoform X1 [Babylonia areolata]|uniref:uncharacterized protein LOC143295420 isoform X1 n=1 Tax=Babylonia areolata TaxID=304850 RepID=UPI003FD0E406